METFKNVILMITVVIVTMNIVSTAVVMYIVVHECSGVVMAED